MAIECIAQVTIDGVVFKTRVEVTSCIDFVKVKEALVAEGMPCDYIGNVQLLLENPALVDYRSVGYRVPKFNAPVVPQHPFSKFFGKPYRK